MKTAWLRRPPFLPFVAVGVILTGALACTGAAFTSGEMTDEVPAAPDAAAANGDASGVLDAGSVGLDTSQVVDTGLSVVDASSPKEAGHPPDVTTVGATDATVDAGCAVVATCPTDVTLPSGNLELWLSADVGVALTDQRVARWQDRSGAGNDATQPDPALRPGVTASWRGENPAISFDAVSNFLALPSGFADFSKGLTLFVVADVTSDQTCPSLFELSNGGESDDITLQEKYGVFLYEVGNSTSDSPADEAPRDKPLLMEVVHSAAEETILLSNGVSVYKGMMPLPPVTPRFKNELGRSSYPACTLFGGHLAEVILYRRGLPETERRTVEDYLQKKWKL